MLGKLFGVGVGPGDPELLTLKAVRVIKSVRYVAYPVLEDNESFSKSVVASYLNKDVIEIPLIVPMTVQRNPAQLAYDLSAKKLAQMFVENFSKFGDASADIRTAGPQFTNS